MCQYGHLWWPPSQHLRINVSKEEALAFKIHYLWNNPTPGYATKKRVCVVLSELDGKEGSRFKLPLLSRAGISLSEILRWEGEITCPAFLETVGRKWFLTLGEGLKDILNSAL